MGTGGMATLQGDLNSILPRWSHTQTHIHTFYSHISNMHLSILMNLTTPEQDVGNSHHHLIYGSDAFLPS